MVQPQLVATHEDKYVKEPLEEGEQDLLKKYGERGKDVR
jgi:hypothetical protein